MRAEAQTKPPLKTMNAALHRPIKKAPTAVNADPAMEFAAGTFKPWDIVVAEHPGYGHGDRPCLVVRRINLNWRERADAEKFTGVPGAGSYFAFGDDADEILYPFDTGEEGYWLLPLSSNGWNEVLIPKGDMFANLKKNSAPQLLTRNQGKYPAGFHFSVFPCNVGKIRRCNAFASKKFKALVEETLTNQLHNGYYGQRFWLDVECSGEPKTFHTSWLPLKIVMTLEAFNPSGCGNALEQMRLSGDVVQVQAAGKAVRSLQRRCITDRRNRQLRLQAMWERGILVPWLPKPPGYRIGVL